MDELPALLTKSATQIARDIRAGRLTSLSAVEAHIARIEAVNPILNAMVCDRFAQARDEARKADAQRAGSTPETLPPLHGVPCTIKEAFALAGMPNSSGLVARRHLRATTDATAVARLRRAGAIPMGVTNVSELCMWMETNNKLYGRTRNPHNPARIVGGSSGGEAALVAAGASPFGLASDVGGSIRMPAFFTGVFGHKPTGGLVPNTGQFPDGVNETARYLTTGPICRRAEDLMPLLRILAGPDEAGNHGIPYRLQAPEDVDLSRLHVLDVPDDSRGPVHPELRAAQQRASRALAAAGAHVETRRLPALADSFHIWSAMMHLSGGPTFKELLGQGRPIHALAHLAGIFLGATPHTFPALGLGVLESLQDLFPARSHAWLKRGIELKRRLGDELGDDTLLLYPPYPTPAPRHNKPLMPPFNWVYTAIFNALEFPVTQVPLGLSRQRLPLGVQVAAGPGMDHLTIAAALHLEKALGGWIPPR